MRWNPPPGWPTPPPDWQPTPGWEPDPAWPPPPPGWQFWVNTRPPTEPASVILAVAGGAVAISPFISWLHVILIGDVNLVQLFQLAHKPVVIPYALAGVGAALTAIGLVRPASIKLLGGLLAGLVGALVGFVTYEGAIELQKTHGLASYGPGVYLAGFGLFAAFVAALTATGVRRAPASPIPPWPPIPTTAAWARPDWSQPTASGAARRPSPIVIAALASLATAVLAGAVALAAWPHPRDHSARTLAASSTLSSAPPSSGTLNSGSLNNSAPSSSANSDPAPAGARALRVAVRYYDAINSHDWAAVWRLGGENLGETYSSMVAGYANTDHDIPYFTAAHGDQVRLYLLAYETSGIAQLYQGRLTITDGAITSATQQLDYTDSPARPFAAIAGDWYGHDRDLQITAGGLVIASYRTFDNCGQLADGCDEFIGNNILNGGVYIARLDSLSGDFAAGNITFANAGDDYGRVNLHYHPSENTVTLSSFPDTPYCGDGAAAGTCGA